MNSLKETLSSIGIHVPSLERLGSTDSGDVLMFESPGGDAAIKTWTLARDVAPQSRHWPVLLGGADEIEFHLEQAEDDPSPIGETLSRAASIRLPEWFTAQDAERLADLREYNPDTDPDTLTAPVGEWPKMSEPSDRFSTPFDIRTRQPLERVLIGLVPTTVPWEVPAYLRFGAFNDCPGPAVHCAVQRYWHDAHGATIVAATHAVIEMSVARPPATRAAAMTLARQQYAYCADIVDQGVETLSNLAAGLLNARAWYFWWD